MTLDYELVNWLASLDIWQETLRVCLVVMTVMMRTNDMMSGLTMDK